MGAIAIVMYHYVRDPATSAFPQIKGRTIAEFRGQLDYFLHHHTLVSAEDVLAACLHKAALPPRPVWLTFDDGYAEHYRTVFPILTELDLRGAFFPTTRPAYERCVLDVNKIQFILAVQRDTATLVNSIRSFFETYHGATGLSEFQEAWSSLAKPSRYDGAETVFVKRVLQHGMPESSRTKLIDELFRRHVTNDEIAFAAELYASPAELCEMRDSGMFIGCHGHSHAWLDKVERQKQIEDIDKSLPLLRRIGMPRSDWIMAYPYGGYDESLTEILRERGCAIALTTRPAPADPETDALLALPRLNTNDFPFER